MKNFIKTIGLTFYSGDLYKKIKDEKSGDAILFLLKITLFLAICLGAIGIIIFLIFSPKLKEGAYNFVQTNFPSDLIVTIKDGKMTTNTNQPFFIKIPTSKKNISPKENIFAILPDESADSSVLFKYNTMMAMTSDGFVTEQNQGQEIRIAKYSKLSIVASKETTLQTINKIFPFLLIFIPIGIIPLMFFIFIFMIIFHLIWLFFVALLVWGFLRLKKLDISYKQSYKIGMYAIVPLLLIEIVLFPFNLSGKLFTVAVILAVVVVVTKNWEKDKAQGPIDILEIKNF